MLRCVHDLICQYETIAGGAGAGPTWQGQDCVHVHMTNVGFGSIEGGHLG